MTWLSRFKILPLLVIVATLSFGVRFTEFVTGVSQTPGYANAEEVVAASEPMPEETTLEEVVEEAQDEEAKTDTKTDLAAPPSMEGGEEIDWRDSTEADLEFSAVKLELFEDLKIRRKQLEQQKRELSVREALLKTAEQELDQKYEELLSLKSEIENLLVQQSEEEQKRVASLVKIYEGMKPKDAARIFNTLDLDILLSVVSRMSERKSAPIIASMSPDRARTLTTMLMQQKTLNDVSTN